MAGFLRNGSFRFGRPVVPVTQATRDTAGNSLAVLIGAFHTLGLTVTVASVSGLSPSVTVTIEHSEDGVTWRDHTSFDAMSSAGSQRFVVSALDMFWRVSWTISDTVTFGVSGFVR